MAKRRKVTADDWHEVMDRVFVLNETLAEYVGKHKAVKADPHVATLVAAAEVALGKVYACASFRMAADKPAA